MPGMPGMTPMQPAMPGVVTQQTVTSAGMPAVMPGAITQTTTISLCAQVPTWSYWGATPQEMGYPAVCDPVMDASRLKSAFRGLGTDNKTVIEIMANRSKEQLAAVAQAYAQKYGKTLEHDLKSETSFNFQKLLLGLLNYRTNLRRELLRYATKGAGTAERYLIDVLAPASNQEILDIHRVDPKAIDMVLDDVTFGNFAKMIRNLVRGNREEGVPVNEDEAKRVAETLYRAGEGRLGTDDSIFVDVFTRRSSAFLQRVGFYYSQTHKRHTLQTAIKKETSGHYKSLLMALSKPRYEFYADRLYKAMHGLGTDDNALIYLFSLLTKAELKQVENIFRQKRNKTLQSMIRGDTSGNYEKLLLELLRF